MTTPLRCRDDNLVPCVVTERAAVWDCDTTGLGCYEELMDYAMRSRRGEHQAFGVPGAPSPSLGRREMMRRPGPLDSGKTRNSTICVHAVWMKTRCGEKALRDALGHVSAMTGTLDFDAVWILSKTVLDAETAQLHKHGSNGWCARLVERRRRHRSNR